MAELKTLYASSLFEMSMEKGTIKGDVAMAAFVRDRLLEKGLDEMLKSPCIPPHDKIELLESLFNSKIPEDLMGFLHLAIKKRHEALILPTLDAYLEMGEEHCANAIAYVVSAKALRPEQVNALAALLSKKLGRPTEILAKENPDLIGGFYIHVNGCLIDRTVRTELKKLTENLKRGETT